MLRVAKRSTRLGRLRRTYAQGSSGLRRRSYLPELGLAAFVAAGTGYFLLVDRRAVDHFYAFKDQQEAVAPSKAKSLSEEATVVEDERDVPVSTVVEEEEDNLVSKVWGSNKNGVILPSTSSNSTPTSARTPVPAGWLNDVALRDLALGVGHAVCVDARGDVYQWGSTFSSDASEPKATLKGKNITSIQLTPNRVYALSSSGAIYVLSSSAAKQSLPAGVPTPASTPWWSTGWIWGEEQAGSGLVDFIELKPDTSLDRKEKFTSISAGTDHLLALTSSGRTFAHPASMKANSNGQLGLSSIDVPVSVTNLTPDSTLTDEEKAKKKAIKEHLKVELPKAGVDLRAVNSPYNRAPYAPDYDDKDKGKKKELVIDDSDIRFCDKLYEIPALRGVPVAQVVAGGRHSFIRTDGGRVLGWGANEYGQIGLGGTVLVQSITRPTEVIPIPATLRKNSTSKVLDVNAGADLSMFTVERRDGTGMTLVDVTACGNGQYGGLGSGLFSNAQSTPIRVKNISGLLEYDEATKSLEPIAPHAISIAPTGAHVFCSLETHERSGPRAGAQQVGGRDLLSWGLNYDGQLGNGKKNTVPVPTQMHLPASKGLIAGPEAQGSSSSVGAVESVVEGARFMLRKRKADVVRDMSGKVWKKGVDVEQVAVAGDGCGVVYWKLC